MIDKYIIILIGKRAVTIVLCYNKLMLLNDEDDNEDGITKEQDCLVWGYRITYNIPVSR